ncbi:hypothetical protein [Helicobacter turcicus]|uniref:Uncharacterized protein n=1 Tax=Helicobacter turcicus TaxID=2867412 RepID=A0ABS7JPE8_9HELI|nr:hypothetical protein [Helicobacter turcicus]MBX7491243.1 hypothetical protein [Helicobacter turcicus]MBX7546118.1 hypothetical protein [Helicobacter turcicus]
MSIHYESPNALKYLNSFFITNNVANNTMAIPRIVNVTCSIFKDSILTTKYANILNSAVKKAKSNVLNKSINFSSFLPHIILFYLKFAKSTLKPFNMESHSSFLKRKNQLHCDSILKGLCKSLRLVKILHFSKEECKMKIDRLKEEVANIRRTQNVIAVALMGVIGYLFTAFKEPHDLRMVLSAFTIGVLIFLLSTKSIDMKCKLKELENAKSED